MTLAYPLQWPDHIPRTPPHKIDCSRFDVSQSIAQNHLVDEIHRLGGSNVVLSTNIPLRRDGMPYSGRKPPDDTGVAVYFSYKNQSRSFACDRYFKVWENMRALGKTIEAMRGISRWGAHEVLDQMFHGFTALPPPDQMSVVTAHVAKQWWETLGVSQGAPMHIREAAYKAMVRNNGGGSVELNAAIEQARSAK